MNRCLDSINIRDEEITHLKQSLHEKDKEIMLRNQTIGDLKSKISEKVSE